MAAVCSEPNMMECSICHEPFTDPKILPCAHLLCRNCLVSLMKSDSEVLCPLCREVIVKRQTCNSKSCDEIADTLPTDHTMSDLIKCAKLLETDHMCCAHDTVAAMSLCLHCGDMLCQPCFDVHGRFSATRHHSVQMLSTLTPEILSANKQTNCLSHPDEPSKLFCSSHGIPICIVCSSSNHSSCQDVMSLRQMMDDSKKMLSNMEQKLIDAQNSFSQAAAAFEKLKDISERNTQTAFKEVDSVCDQLKQSIETCRHRLKYDLQTEAEEVNTVLTSNIKLMQQKLGKVISHRLLFQRVQQTASSSSIRVMLNLLNTRLDNLDLKVSLPLEEMMSFKEGKVNVIHEDKVSCIDKLLTDLNVKGRNDVINQTSSQVTATRQHVPASRFNKEHDGALGETHVIDQNITVRRYMECLGLLGGNPECDFTPKKSLTMTDVDSYKVAFVRHSSTAQDDFVRQLSLCHAVPKFVRNTLTVECTLTSAVPNAQILARSWARDVKQAIGKYMDLVDVHTLNINPEVWNEVDMAVSSITNKECAAYFLNPTEKIIRIVGVKTMANDLFQQISTIVKFIEEQEVDRKKEIKETNKNLQTYHLRLLAAISFHRLVEQRYKGLKVDIRPEKGEIIFQGILQNVREAQIEMFSHLMTTRSHRITELSQLQNMLLGKKDTRDLIEKRFKTEQIVAVLEETQEDAFVHAFTDTVVVQAVRIVYKVLQRKESEWNRSTSK